jgi:hypothetical protein
VNLSVADYFTLSNPESLNGPNLDWGLCGPVLWPHLLVGCDKQGKIFLLNRDNLGQFSARPATMLLRR